RHLHRTQSHASPHVELELKEKQLYLRGVVPDNMRSCDSVHIELAGLQRQGAVDPGDASFTIVIPHAPGAIQVRFATGEAGSTGADTLEIPGFSPIRLGLAKALLLPRFLFRLALLVPQAWRWFRHKDIGARTAFRDTLGLAPLIVAQPLQAGELPMPVMHKAEPAEATAPVTIVMPVFNAFEVLGKALSRLERHTDRDWLLVLVEDCSTDRRIRPFLREWAARVNAQEAAGRVELLENAENLGFIGAVNRGFEWVLAFANQAPDRAGEAVVLLNSDALLPADWADRLLAPLAGDERVASVTPMSNDAELLCVPFLSRPVPLRPGIADALDQRAARHPQDMDRGCVMPTGVGFCMAMRLSWLRKVGTFDSAFGPGYGEEVDWCRRAHAMGGRHMAQPRLFVEHRGGASFGSEEKQKLLARNGARLSRRYPSFDPAVQDFIRNDPLLTPRLVLGMKWAALEAEARDTGPVPVYLAHSLGGGAEMDLKRRLRRHIETSAAAVVLRVGAGVANWQVELHGAHGITMASTDDITQVARLLDLLPQRRVIYSCGVGCHDPAGLPDILLELGSAETGGWDVLFHDFLPLSPSYTLLGKDGLFHGLPMPGETADPAHSVHRPDGSWVDLAGWRAAWGRLMAAAERVKVFSQSSKSLVAAAYPEQAEKIRLAPHAQLHDVQPVTTPKAARPVIGVLGNIAPHKGAAVLTDLSRLLAKNRQAQLVVLGRLDPGFRLEKPAVVHGQYAPQDLPDLVARYRISAWLIPSIWPETFSFVTHEALATGLPVFAFDLGAQGDLVRFAERGIVVPMLNGQPDLDFLIERLTELATAETNAAAL
ncbi:MAG TPA: glycosyltransferase, partial [Rhodobacterales bacterium]|nr:glycosyltransferase [Rhodobacterales bacterium]